MSRKLPAPIKKFRMSSDNIDVAEELRVRGVNPVEEILFEMGRLSDAKDRIRVYFELLKYCAPQMKTIDPPVDAEVVVEVSTENVEELWKKAHRAIHDQD